MQAVALSGLIILSLFLCVTAVALCRISIQRDGVMLFFALQALGYLVVAPLLVVATGEQVVTTDYPWFWIWSFILYFPLLFFSYGALVARVPKLRGISIEYKSRRSASVFTLISVLLLALYYMRALDEGYFFRRIGSEEAAQLFAHLSLFDLLLIKFHDMAAPAILLLLVIAMRSRGCPRSMKFAALIFAADVFTFALLNSRTTLIGIFAFVGIMMLWTGLRPARLFIRLLVVVPIFAYMMIVLLNFRSGFLHGSYDLLDVLNPFMERTGAPQGNSHEWIDRLNCFDLIQMTTPALDRHGFAMGRAWYNPIISLVGPLFGSPEAAFLKAAGITTAKSYMIGQYTHMNAIDYQSCGLTDAYGNFGPAGFAIAAIVHGVILGLVTRALMFGGRGWKLLAIIIASYYFMLFEQEFFNFAVGWVRVVPWVIILAFANPIRRFWVITEPRPAPRQLTPEPEPTDEPLVA